MNYKNWKLYKPAKYWVAIDHGGFTVACNSNLRALKRELSMILDYYR